MSAAQFVERMFGELPELFKDEDELRKIWKQPETRSKLLDGLAERGYGVEQLEEIKTMISAEKSDLFDVLAYIAFALAPLTRADRAKIGKQRIASEYSDELQMFLGFVLSQYVSEGVGELDSSKLPDLLELRYNGVNDATAQLGSVQEIRGAFVGFQRHLY